MNTKTITETVLEAFYHAVSIAVVEPLETEFRGRGTGRQFVIMVDGKSVGEVRVWEKAFETLGSKWPKSTLSSGSVYYHWNPERRSIEEFIAEFVDVLKERIASARGEDPRRPRMERLADLNAEMLAAIEGILEEVTPDTRDALITVAAKAKDA